MTEKSLAAGTSAPASSTPARRNMLRIEGLILELRIDLLNMLAAAQDGHNYDTSSRRRIWLAEVEAEMRKAP